MGCPNIYNCCSYNYLTLFEHEINTKDKFSKTKNERAKYRA